MIMGIGNVQTYHANNDSAITFGRIQESSLYQLQFQ